MKLLFSLLIVLTCSGIYAQQKFTINGYVRDAANGEAMIGATVFVQELKTGAVTNEYGFYSITIPSAKYELKISYLGYGGVSKEVSLDQNIRLDIEMQPETQQLQEVQVGVER
ncbi:MAG TPA: carboxypeptidase-like regulatory domain-containing protein, partial [Cyclobacteriaceae bacterium]|nr:carboxypeptidase-like regulatory domain-containing protein [Cyclobacteriaceae bacterium]